MPHLTGDPYRRTKRSDLSPRPTLASYPNTMSVNNFFANA
jgi:hypothetical protein